MPVLSAVSPVIMVIRELHFTALQGKILSVKSDIHKHNGFK